MSWSIHTNDMARISSYRDAENHWESKPEWKNEYTTWRPLAGRRKRHIRLEKHNGGGSYECVLYQTALVTYWSDGSVTLRTYDSNSSVLFAARVSPGNCSPISHRGGMYWKIWADKGLQFHRGTIQLRPHEKGWEIKNLDQLSPELEWVTDLKKAAQTRKLLRPYTQWHEMTSRLKRLPAPHMHSSIYDAHVSQLLQNPTEFEDYPELAQVITPGPYLRNTAYRLTGAHTKVPVPFDRLPRIRA